jgi:hypothetical protein
MRFAPNKMHIGKPAPLSLFRMTIGKNGRLTIECHLSLWPMPIFNDCDLVRHFIELAVCQAHVIPNDQAFCGESF